MKIGSGNKTELQVHLDKLQDVADAMEASIKSGNNFIFNGVHNSNFTLQEIFNELGSRASHPFHCGALVQMLMAVMKEQNHAVRHSFVGACYMNFLSSGMQVPEGLLYQHNKELVYNEDGTMEDVTEEPEGAPEEEEV